MNLHISSIRIQCENGSVLIPFDEHISFFYGNTGVGKTTMLSLINYALGQDLVRTRIVDNTVKRVCLDLYIEKKRLMIERNIRSNIISVIDGDSSLFFFAKGKSTELRQNFSDYLYDLAGVRLAEVVLGSGTNSMRISFSNYMWFSYLRQDELDNTLFYLENKTASFKYYASRFVLNTLLGKTLDDEMDTIQRINNLRSKEDELKNKVAVFRDLSDSCKLLRIDLATEIAKKRGLLNETSQNLSKQTASFSNGCDTTKSDILQLVDLARTVGKYEAELRYLREFEKLTNVRISYESLRHEFANNIENLENKYSDESNVIKQNFSHNLLGLSETLKSILLEIKFPDLYPDDNVRINPTTLIPSVYSFSGEYKYDYVTLSSSGIRTIFKICFALAIRCFIVDANQKSLLPSLLIVDTPMKNISERVDLQIYENLYRLLFNLFSGSGKLSHTQLILVDKEPSNYFETNGVSCKEFSKGSPLIPHNIE